MDVFQNVHGFSEGHFCRTSQPKWTDYSRERALKGHLFLHRWDIRGRFGLDQGRFEKVHGHFENVRHPRMEFVAEESLIKDTQIKTRGRFELDWGRFEKNPHQKWIL